MGASIGVNRLARVRLVPWRRKFDYSSTVVASGCGVSGSIPKLGYSSLASFTLHEVLVTLKSNKTLTKYQTFIVLGWYEKWPNDATATESEADNVTVECLSKEFYQRLVCPVPGQLGP